MPPIEGYPEIIEIYDPNPITVTWHADFTYAKQPPSVSLLLGAHHPARRRRHHVLQRLPGVRGALRRPARDRSTDSRAVHYATQLAIDKGMPEDEIVNSHPVARTHPETGRKRAVRQRQLHAPLRRLERCDDSQPLLEHLYAQFARFEYTWRHRWQAGDLAHLGQPLRAARRSSATPTARSVSLHRTTIAGDTPHDQAVTDIPWIVSLDDHVVEPPDIWTSRLPGEVPRHRPAHRAWRRPADPVLTGGTYREEPGHRGRPGRVVVLRGPAVLREAPDRRGGLPAPTRSPSQGITFDQMRPGCWQPAARLDDMTLNHVEASLVLPELPALLRPDLPQRGRTRTLAKLCVEAYNDWRSTSGAAGRGGRLDPALPDPAVGRRARRRRGAPQRGPGVRAVCFSELPPWLGLPSIHSGHWDPFFAACVGDRHGRCDAHRVRHEDDRNSSRRRRPTRCRRSTMFANSALSLIDFLYSGVLVRFPDLRLLYAEAQIGWIPYVLERVDDVWEVHHGWSDSQSHVPDPPSQYYYRQVVGCFFKDGVGIEQPRPRRPRQHRVRDRLPAPGRHLAQHAPGRQGAVLAPRRADGARHRARQRDPVARPAAPGTGPERQRRRRRRRDHIVSDADAGARRRSPRSAPRPSGCWRRSARPPTGPPVVADNLVEADLRGVDSHGVQPDGALPSTGSRAGTSAPTPRSRRSPTAARPSASTVASASARSSASTAIDLAIERATANTGSRP